ncbi:MAG: glycosyltransferase family 39 protein [Chloroflexota bacterium]|nr:glycosyltransferase family 39 protein [Chloroflexota bacterium]
MIEARSLARYRRWARRWVASIRQFMAAQRMRMGLIPILWLAFTLRLYRLGAKNLWWDEALAIWAVRKGLVGMTLWTAGDVHPPLFFWTLWGWVQLAGAGEFAARFLSVSWGLLTVALLYRLSRRLFDNKLIGLLSALLLATARFHVWWSQELRMYILAACFVALSLDCFTQLYRGDKQGRTWIGYILSTTAALYSLYLAALILIVENGFLALVALAGRRRVDWLRWLGAQAAILLLFAPWLALALPRMRTWSVSEPFDFALFLRLYVLLLSTGISTSIGRYRPLIWGFTLLALGGLIGLWQQKGGGWERGLLLLLLLALPPLAVYLLTLPRGLFYSPHVEARYLVTFASAYYLLLAATVGLTLRRSRWGGALLGLAVLGTFGWTLRDHYRARYLRDEFQSAVRTIGAYAHSDDAVLLVSGNRFPVFRYYYERLIPAEQRPKLYELPRYAHEITPQNVEQELTSAIEGHPRAWLMLAESHLQDPEGLVERWMEDHYTPALSYAFYHNRLILYAPKPMRPAVPARNLAPQYPLERKVAGNTLLGYDMPTSEYRPEDVIHLGLYWREDASARVQVELVDGRGRVVESHSLIPWSDGLIRRQQVDFTVLRFTPGGCYHFRLRTPEGGLAFGRLSVQRTRSLPPAGSPDHPLEARLGEAIRFHGYDIAPEEGVQPGETLTFDLYWEATGEIARDYTVFVHLLGPPNPATGGPVWAQHDSQPMEGQHPTSRWLAGSVIQDRHVVALPPDMPPGEYQVEIGLYLLTTGERLMAIQPDGAHDTRILLEPVDIVR